MKNNHTINCPACHHAFPLENALTAQLREKIETELRTSFDTRLSKEREQLTIELTKGAEAKATRTHAAKMAELETSATEREITIKRLQTQLGITQREASQRAAEAFSAERKGFEEELTRQRTALADLRRNELILRQEKTKLESARHELEVEAARKLDAERARLRDELCRQLNAERVRVREEISSAHSETLRLKDAEHAQQMQIVRKQTEELRRKLEAGGEQRRGEVCEVLLEDFLRAEYPGDTIEPVARGANGADVCQRICPPGRTPCGTIIYEHKATVAWNQNWLPKLKEDQREERADVAVLVTATLPKGVTHIAQIEGVWVTSFQCLPGLSRVLRHGVLQVAALRQAAIGRGEKMDLLYSYVTGKEFRQQIESLFEVYADMEQDLSKEKRMISAAWKRREKHLERFSNGVTGFFAAMQGIIGEGALPTINALQVTDFLEDFKERRIELPPLLL